MTKTNTSYCLIIFLLLFSLHLTAQELIPLKLGNYWIYKETTYKSDTIVSIDTTLNNVSKKLKLNNKQCYALNEFDNEFFVYNTKDGQTDIDTFNVEPNGNFAEALFYKNPEDIAGSSYTVYNVNNIHVDEKPVMINTITGDFKCYKYTLTVDDDDEYKIVTFLCPGIGIIYEEFYFDHEHIKSELIEYHIK